MTPELVPLWVRLIVPILSGLLGSVGAIVVALVTLRAQSRKMKEELVFEREKFSDELRAQKERLEAEFGTEVSAERALRHFLSLHELPYRSFRMIRHHVGGFESNELRRLLVRSGAARFMAADGTELWALVDRVPDDFKQSRWKHMQAPANQVAEASLFPKAFNDPAEY
jgi:hypothetical protein